MTEGSPKPTKPKRRRRQIVSHSRLEAQRNSLFKRLERLHPKLTQKQGYRSARILLTSQYMRAANLAARLAILQAAHFMIGILEMTPPL